MLQNHNIYLIYDNQLIIPDIIIILYIQYIVQVQSKVTNLQSKYNYKHKPIFTDITLEAQHMIDKIIK